MPRIDVDLLLAETRGLPMLVREYVEAFRAVPPGSGPAAAGQRAGPVPDPAAGGQRARQADAHGGRGARSDNDADLLRAVSGRGEDEIVEAIDETLARSLLAEIAPVSARQASPPSAPSYGFPDEALRRTAYESATLARRRLLHGRAAAALIRRHERDPAATGAATVAGHLQLAGRDGEAAQWWWRAAAVARELYAHAEAHAHLARALALGYPELPGRVALAEVLVVLGRYREALAELETAAAIAAEGEPATQAAQAQAGPAQADGQRDAAMIHLEEAARRFAAVDVGDAPRPEIWTLVEW
jgi:tetratricopeptide (TPR) repeat protein